MPLPEDLQKKQDADLAKAQRLSFDFEVFDRELQSSDMITMMIRAHLYLEHVLIQTALDAFIEPEEMS